MTYVDRINAFWAASHTDTRLKSNHKVLYFALLQINNLTDWSKTFLADYKEVMHYASFTSQGTYYKSLEELQEWGYIKYTPGKNRYLQAQFELILVLQNRRPTKRAKGNLALDLPLELEQEQEETLNIRPLDPKTLRPLDNNENSKKDLQKISETAEELIAKHSEEKNEEPPPTPSDADVDVHTGEVEECEVLESFPFESFWDLYDKKVDKPDCEKLWRQLKERDKEQIMLSHLPEYVAANEKQFRKDPIRYLRKRAWENEVIYNDKNNSNGTRANNLRGGNGYSLERAVEALDNVSRRWENGGAPKNGHR